jgi:hypothetical protein
MKTKKPVIRNSKIGAEVNLSREEVIRLYKEAQENPDQDEFETEVEVDLYFVDEDELLEAMAEAQIELKNILEKMSDKELIDYIYYERIDNKGFKPELINECYIGVEDVIGKEGTIMDNLKWELWLDKHEECTLDQLETFFNQIR